MIIHSVGQEFEDGVTAFRIALANYTVECGFAVNYLKNDATRVTAKCMIKSSASCKWFVHGRVLMNSGIFFIIKLDNVHACGVVARRSCNKMVGSRFVSDIVYNDISDNPLTRPIEVKKKLKKQYSIYVSYRVTWLGVDKARGGLFGDFVTSFNQLRWYLEMGMTMNPGSVFELDVDESSGSGLFSEGLFPLAFAIVEAENKIIGCVFFKSVVKAMVQARDCLCVGPSTGLLDALSQWFFSMHIMHIA
ncbi:uncharacterized protein LOC114284241 [Camellia sinensis]|uniref:uncharacterized protein LOC114284241 n=1 Tax=Camellia sinensis TaxID=4442 RepID=UPI0010355D2F|nr:uncharacterized protein LOC114284241 [Camellia sinensis]